MFVKPKVVTRSNVKVRRNRKRSVKRTKKSELPVHKRVMMYQFLERSALLRSHQVSLNKKRIVRRNTNTIVSVTTITNTLDVPGMNCNAHHNKDTPATMNLRRGIWQLRLLNNVRIHPRISLLMKSVHHVLMYQQRDVQQRHQQIKRSVLISKMVLRVNITLCLLAALVMNYNVHPQAISRANRNMDGSKWMPFIHLVPSTNVLQIHHRSILECHVSQLIKTVLNVNMVMSLLDVQRTR
mmetsp:Transcript_35022/g.39994  ORF Transcript_35022/g.39994 Transcript_35022/m.39994 type:complete len:239 (+) Transcript_35022:371-1087(+)